MIHALSQDTQISAARSVPMVQKAPPSYIDALLKLKKISLRTHQKAQRLIDLYQKSGAFHRNISNYHTNFNQYTHLYLQAHNETESPSDRAYEKWRKLLQKVPLSHRDILVRLCTTCMPRFSTFEREMLSEALDLL